jgi:hypothetical protein
MQQSSTKARMQELGKRLCRFGYAEIEKELSGLDLDGDSLIELLSHRSRKVADSAFSLLNRMDDGSQLVVGAVLSGRFTHRDAKIRATNFLAWRGRACSEAMKVYLHFLDDRNLEVVDSALFGVVFFQDKGQIESLERRRDGLPAGTKIRETFDEAIRALREENPFLYSPGFHDAADVWALDRKRFADRIGSL